MQLRIADDPFRLSEPIMKGNLSFGMQSFAYNAPRLYNKVPPSVKSLTSTDAFKTQLKSYFFARSYDTSSNSIRLEYQVM